MAQAPRVFVRLLTLTLKHSPTPLAEQLDRLYACFRRFRRHTDIRGRIRGGIAFLEIKASPTSKEWHPHLHVLFEGSFLPHELAKTAWQEITTDSFIVDVRKIGSAEQGGRYLLKYATKAISPIVWNDPALLDEAIQALAGRRTFNAFGTWRELSLSRPLPDTVEWIPLAPLHQVINKATNGDVVAQNLLRLLRRTDLELPVDTTPGP
jgi:hypothetical protein